MKWEFWKWLFLGLKDKPGISNFLNWILLLHIGVGLFLATFIDVSLYEAAKTVLLPLAGIFIGLSFAWAGNAQAMLKESEIERFADFHRDGIRTYVYTFQLAILVILLTLIAWGLAGLKFFELPVFSNSCVKYGIEAMLYFLASLTMRECWHVVIGSQILILSRYHVRKVRRSKAPVRNSKN